MLLVRRCETRQVEKDMGALSYKKPKSDIKELTSEFSRVLAALR